MVDSTELPDVDINQIATDLNGKMDRDGVNASCPVVVSRTANNQGGIVEIWSDGYCVQTGVVNVNYNNTGTNVLLTQEYITTNYNILLSMGGNAGSGVANCSWSNKTITGFTIWGDYSHDTASNIPTTWRTEGYIR